MLSAFIMESQQVQQSKKKRKSPELADEKHIQKVTFSIKLNKNNAAP